MKKSKWSKYLLVIIAWLILLVILDWVFSSRMPHMAHVSGIPDYWHFYMAMTALIFKTIFLGVVILVILPRFSRKRNLMIFAGQSVTLLGVCFITEQYIQADITMSSWSGVHSSDHGLLSNNPFWTINLFIYIFVLLVICSYYFTREWVRNEKQKRELIEMQLGTELKFLKNQVHPHFLFNTLNNLFSIAQRNKDVETADGISKLAGLMRYMLYDSSVAKVSLEKEMKSVNDFIALSKLRYTNEEVIVDMRVTGDIANSFIAPMILLPFVENAFKHGVVIEEKTVILITVEVLKGKIIFQCTNPIAGSSVVHSQERGGIGLENVKRRLALVYPQKHILNIMDSGNTFAVYLELEA